jgi:hypothetical protein
MKKKRIAALLVSDVALPNFSAIVISVLLSSSMMETMHRFGQLALPGDHVHEEPYKRTPLDRGCANAYVTTRAMVAASVSDVSTWIR